MTDDKKKELLQNKFTVILQAAFKDKQNGGSGVPSESEFVKLFNAVKGSDAYFETLAGEEKLARQAEVQQAQDAIVVHEAKIAELDQVISKQK